MKTLLGLALGTLLFVAATARTQDVGYGTLAEGRSSPNSKTGIVAAYRMFSVPDNVCATILPISRLVVRNQPITLLRGRWFSYDRLVVLAFDRAGNVVPAVPISIGVEDVHPSLLNLRGDMIASDRVLPIRRGKFRFAVTAVCQEPAVTVVATARVVDP